MYGTPTAHPQDIDVAFTFLARDEDTAKELARLLSGSVSTFVYSERQKEPVGKDGVSEFTDLGVARERVTGT